MWTRMSHPDEMDRNQIAKAIGEPDARERWGYQSLDDEKKKPQNGRSTRSCGSSAAATIVTRSPGLWKHAVTRRYLQFFQ